MHIQSNLVELAFPHISFTNWGAEGGGSATQVGTAKKGYIADIWHISSQMIPIK